MEIAAFKVKSRNLLVLTFGYSNLNISIYRYPIVQTQFCWIPDSKAYQCSKFQPKKKSYQGYIIFQRWQLNSASKQVSWRNESKLRSEASKPISKFLFQEFSSSESKLEDFMQDYFFFFRKIVIKVLKCKLFT
jgi:hypothetical protein